MDDSISEITSLLHAARDDPNSAERLMRLVYDELRGLARWQLSQESPEHTLQATALVHEAYMKLVPSAMDGMESRKHFFAVAARAMRQILVDHARSKHRIKRGGNAKRKPLDDMVTAYEARVGDLSALHEALTALAEHDEEKARIVELRFFAGLTMPQIAELLGASQRSTERKWMLARAWLRCAMDDRDEEEA